MNQNTLPFYLLCMANSGWAIAKSKIQQNTYNLTKDKDKLMLRKGWQDNKFDWFASPVDSHGANGKLTGETKWVAEWSEHDNITPSKG